MDALSQTIDFLFSFIVDLFEVIGGNDIFGLFLLLIVIYLFISALTGGAADK